MNNPLLSVDEYIYIHRHGPELLTPFTTVVAPSIAALTNPVNNSDTVTILGLPQDPSPVSVAGSTGSNHSVLGKCRLSSVTAKNDSFYLIVYTYYIFTTGSNCTAEL